MPPATRSLTVALVTPLLLSCHVLCNGIGRFVSVARRQLRCA